MPSYALAVDIGGTFTDAVLRRHDGATWVDKVLTTHRDLLDGFFAAVELVLARAGAASGQVDDVVVHATTIVTNALLERRGPPTALLVTEGFRDVLRIRDEHRYDMYDPQIEFPEPLVPPELTFAVRERTLADGSIATKVDEAEVTEIARLLSERGVVSVAIAFLNSYRNPENEQAAGATLSSAAPSLYLSLSSDIAPQIREYPRTSTTVINAYTRPITEPYLTALGERLRRAGFPNAPLMMLSSGGVVGAETAGRYPVRMIESGPAAGALAASYFAETLGLERLMSFDMGGTTAKACLIERGQPLVAGLFEVDRVYRFKAGSGQPVTVPSIDLIEIGAGGGSIASVNELGLLKVGPHSAGSEPGPACYAKGGSDATVTDADLVLGLLDADGFLGGDMKLDAEAGRQAVGAVAERLGVEPAVAAGGIYKVVAEAMAAAVRAHATDRGVDARGLPILAFGGAGPVHACAVAELLGSDTVIFPPNASVLSAFGTLVSPLRLDLVRGLLSPLAGIDWAELDRLLSAAIETGIAALEAAGCPRSAIGTEFAADLRYVGQQSEVTVTLPDDPRRLASTAEIRQEFETAYRAQYGLLLDDVEVEVVSWRVTVSSPRPNRQPGGVAAPAGRRPEPHRRPVHLWHSGQSVPVHRRSEVASDSEIAGPAIIEERETTIIVPPGWRAAVDPLGSIVARREQLQ
ncbi:MAG TPA: hydantoinase/oxoprolinase family protein [Stellaceae bacterium]|nr:hydantoinase/oxoprolinase family protein [Stellaceae bacterium]